jgi:hypothetical protein
MKFHDLISATGEILRSRVQLNPNTETPAGCHWAPSPPPPLTEQDYSDALQQALDAAARQRGYDGILSACSYAAIDNPFQAESIAFLTWRSDVWQYGYAVLSGVQAGNPAPSLSALVAGMPALALP